MAAVLLHTSEPVCAAGLPVAGALPPALTRELNAHPAAAAPLLINLCGIPGAGKSTLLRQLRNRPEYAGFLPLAFDELMEQLPEYRAESDPERAFRRGEAPARALGYALLEQAVARRLNLLFEHSSACPEHVALFRALRQLPERPYRIRMLYLACPPELARRRIAGRARFVPPELIRQRHAVLTDLINRYYRSDREVVDEFIELDGAATRESLL